MHKHFEKPASPALSSFFIADVIWTLIRHVEKLYLALIIQNIDCVLLTMLTFITIRATYIPNNKVFSLFPQ